MIIAIAGGRDIPFTPENIERANKLLLDSNFAISVLRSGACGVDADDPNRHDKLAKGADRLFEELAGAFGCPIERFYAAFHRFGPAAGPMRTRKMLEGAHGLVTLEGGRGTNEARRQACRKGVPMYPPCACVRHIAARGRKPDMMLFDEIERDLKMLDEGIQLKS